jgi:F-type H+-transporting ATPase subunit b
VLVAIAKRKAAIDQSLSDAETRHKHAEELEQQYKNRLDAWEREKEGLRAALDDEFRKQRERMDADLRKALEQEREKERVLAERRLVELENRAQAEGVAKGVKFTARLLERIASPELESRLVGLALEDLPHLPGAQIRALEDACSNPQRSVKIATAFPLADAGRAQVLHALQQATHQNVIGAFEEDSSIVAGLRMSIGPWTVRANLQDELQFFAEMENSDGLHH